MIASSQMWGADDHKATYVAVRRYIANFGKTSRTDEPLALEFRMANAEAGRRSVWKARWEAHHHQVCRRV